MQAVALFLKHLHNSFPFKTLPYATFSCSPRDCILSLHKYIALVSLKILKLRVNVSPLGPVGVHCRPNSRGREKDNDGAEVKLIFSLCSSSSDTVKNHRSSRCNSFIKSMF